MKNGFIFFFGLFFVLALSWAGLVLGTNAQLGDLAPFYDDMEGKAFPERAPGIASRGLAGLSGPRLRRLPHPAGAPARLRQRQGPRLG
jgi:hypothetical protein